MLVCRLGVLRGGVGGDDDLDKQICFSVAVPVLSALPADQTNISSSLQQFRINFFRLEVQGCSLPVGA